MPLRRPRFDPSAKAARARQLTWQTGQRARRAKRQLALLVPLTAGTIAAYLWREELFGTDVPVRVATAIVLVALGWALARDVGRALVPSLFQRLDPATAGTIGFLIPPTFPAVAPPAALRVARVQARTPGP